MKHKILVSSCLLGERVRYDGQIKRSSQSLIKLQQEGYIVMCCPEVDGGLSVPRPPAEIACGDGRDVLMMRCDIIRRDGTSVRDAFIKGAEHALSLVEEHNIKVAILKSKSPSCSNSMIYDGTFSGTLKKGIGVTTALLRANGVSVYSEEEIDAAIAHYMTL